MVDTAQVTCTDSVDSVTWSYNVTELQCGLIKAPYCQVSIHNLNLQVVLQLANANLACRDRRNEIVMSPFVHQPSVGPAPAPLREYREYVLMLERFVFCSFFYFYCFWIRLLPSFPFGHGMLGYPYEPTLTRRMRIGAILNRPLQYISPQHADA